MHFKLTQCCQLYLNKAGRRKVKVGTSYTPIIHMLVCLMVIYVSLRFCSIILNFFFSLFFGLHNLYHLLIFLSVQIYCELLCCVFHLSYCIFQLQNFHWSFLKVTSFSLICLQHLWKLTSPSPLVKAQLVKNPPAMWEAWVQSLCWEDPPEKGQATHSSILAWKIPRTTQSMGSQRVRHD